MLFTTKNFGKDFATIAGADSASWKLFERYARAEHTRDVWYNNPTHYFCTIKLVQKDDPTRPRIIFCVAERENSPYTPSSIKLIKKIYKFYKKQSGDDAELITYCTKRLISEF